MNLTRWILSPGRYRLWVRALRFSARAWRACLFRTSVIGITGTAGKTTAKECLAGVLGTPHSVVKTFDTQNDLHGVPRTLLRVRPWHKFAVMEFGAAAPGYVGPMAALARPVMAVVLCVAESHVKNHGSLDNIAREKARLVEALPAGGVAVLNADDPRVVAMASRCQGRVVTFGRGEGCDFRATGISAVWPDRLSFSVTHLGQTHRIQTQYVGEQYVSSVLAAVAAAVCRGIELGAAAAAVAGVAPHRARTQPVELSSGAVILRDEFGGNWLHVRAGLQVLKTARAKRRIAVLGLVSECGKRYQACARQLGLEAAQCADGVVFVGRGHHHGAKGAVQGGLPVDSVRSYDDLRDAAEFLKQELRDGDVVYMSGRVQEHLTRIAYAQLGKVGCWKSDCKLPILCDYCPELGFRSGAS